MNWRLSNDDDAFAFLRYWSYRVRNASLMITKVTMNNLTNIFEAMRTGQYIGITGANKNTYVGIVNSIMREDGSGKKWIVTITANLKSNKVFIHTN